MLRRCTLIAGAGLLVLATTAAPAFAQPKPNKGQCVSELARAGFIGRGSNPGQANIIVGTEGDDTFDPALFTDGVDLVCGFGGNDHVPTLGEVTDVRPFPGSGDVFLGGEGNDSVQTMWGGTVVGGAGDDTVVVKITGTFFGEAGNDRVIFNDRGTFFGGDGDDMVAFSGAFGGIFEGGAGNDSVDFLQAFEGTALFNGDEGDDRVTFLSPGGVFNGGPGNDTVIFFGGGTFNQD